MVLKGKLVWGYIDTDVHNSTVILPRPEGRQPTARRTRTGAGRSGLVISLSPGTTLVWQLTGTCPLAIKAAGISCEICCHRTDLYRMPQYRQDPGCSGSRGDKAGEVINLEEGKIINTTTGKVYQAAPFPKFMRELIAAGGLIPYVRSRLNC